ncbi:MAG: hypothetical protein ISS82_03520 [Nanoarchaeota archaeon]|nr:hypothetical protein [Nanoarchaeota archaeon]
MISLQEIKKLIEKSENPLIFFDDDPDGLCSYLLIKRYFDKGKGVFLKSSPELGEDYVKKVNEVCPDLIIILDKPKVSQDFVDKVNVPVIYIDHHTPFDVKGVKYFNPRIKNPKDNRPVSYWCYKLVKHDLWVAMIGIIGDWCLANIKEFSKKYKDLLPKKFDAPDTVLFDSKLGELVKIFSFILKGNTSDINRAINILTKIENPYEILEQKTARGNFIYKQAQKMKKEYEYLLEDIIENVDPNKRFIIYVYTTNKNSYTSMLSNELLHKFKDKIIIVGREKKDEIRMSLRSSKKKLPKAIEKSLEGLEGYGGGHEHACGSCIKKKDFNEFVRRLEKYL